MKCVLVAYADELHLVAADLGIELLKSKVELDIGRIDRWMGASWLHLALETKRSSFIGAAGRKKESTSSMVSSRSFLQCSQTPRYLTWGQLEFWRARKEDNWENREAWWLYWGWCELGSQDVPSVTCCCAVVLYGALGVEHEIMQEDVDVISEDVLNISESGNRRKIRLTARMVTMSRSQ